MLYFQNKNKRIERIWVLFILKFPKIKQEAKIILFSFNSAHIEEFLIK